MSAEEVLTAFRHDAPYLFLGAAFAAVGIVSAAFAVLRRRRDSLLICFALFAAVYGVRLWISSPMLAMMAQGATFYIRLRGAVNYVTLIPALLFFISLGLPRRFERVVGYAMVGFGCLLAAATLLFGDSPHYERINSIAVISASGFFLVRFMVSASAERIAPEASDFGLIRWGLLVFVALENGVEAAVIDTLTNRVIANVPIGQTSQALVYVPNAVPAGDGTDNLVPLGEAGNTACLRLEAGGTALPDAQGWVAVNSLGSLDLVQIAAKGLTPKSQYQVYLAESAHAPFGKLEPLAVLKTNPDGAGIVQGIGPLKTLAGTAGAAANVPSQRFLIVTDLKDSSQVVLQQASF